MATEPVLGFLNHLFITTSVSLDLQVAALVLFGTLLYVTRIAGISVMYGLGRKPLDHQEVVGVIPVEVEQPLPNASLVR